VDLQRWPGLEVRQRGAHTGAGDEQRGCGTDQPHGLRDRGDLLRGSVPQAEQEWLCHLPDPAGLVGPRRGCEFRTGQRARQLSRPLRSRQSRRARLSIAFYYLLSHMKTSSCGRPLRGAVAAIAATVVVAGWQPIAGQERPDSTRVGATPVSASSG